MLGEVGAYPSNMVSYNENIYFVDGTFNGFQPNLYHLENSFTNLNKIYTFNSTSNSGPSVIPIGIQNSSLFFFSNLDASKGRELYKIGINISTSLNETKESSFDFKLQNHTLNIKTKNDNASYEISLFNMAGALLHQQILDSNTSCELPRLGQNTIVFVKEKTSGAILARQYFIP